MILPHRMSMFCLIILILLFQISLCVRLTNKCPIGFEISYTKDDITPICYRLKGPERFTDTFRNCTGNLYTAKLYDNLMISNRTELVLWTEYRSAYAGGPFVDVSYTSTTGSFLETSFDAANPHLGIEEELCVAKDPFGNYIAERCDKQFYRYCFVEPYTEEPDSEGCEGLKGSIRFYSPTPMCLAPIPGARGIGIRATWSQSHKKCSDINGSILYNGWRYSSDPNLHLSSTYTGVYPLRVTYNPTRNITFTSEEEGLRWNCGGWTPYKLGERRIETHPCTYESEHDKKLFADTVKAKRRLAFKRPSNETLYGMISDNVWKTTNSSYVFYDLICERGAKLKEVTLIVKENYDKKLILVASENLEVDDIQCFTDSVTYYPTPVTIRYDVRSNTYILKPTGDGNYWCIYRDTKRFNATKSNEFLWIREEESLKHRYAVKIKLKKEYMLDEIKDSKKIWDEKLKDYIFYSTMYRNSTGTDNMDIKDPEEYERDLRIFRNVNPRLDKGRIYFETKLKQLYLDRKTVLLHVQLDPTMRAVFPGWWENMMVVIMQPVRYCSYRNKLFVDIIHEDCKMHKCTGNFNLGLTVVTESDEICPSTEIYKNETSPTARSSSSSEDSDDADLNTTDEPTSMQPPTNTAF